MTQEITNNENQIIFYQTDDGQTRLEVALQNETVWLSQAQMADLFQKDVSTISRHINNIFEEGELVEEKSTLKQANLQKMQSGLDKPTVFYNLDVIISVGYRVKSHRGTQFRIWATQQLREFIVKGFVMDDTRLAQGGTVNGINYFDEMLERVRKIRASEKNFYQKVRDIFATSIDYDPKTDYAKEFYASVQNKFHYAITGYTAAELIIKRVDGKKPHLGLTTFKGSEVTRADAEIAKNYMGESELRQLYLLVEQFLSYAELQIERKKVIHMSDWLRKLDGFLQLNEMEILSNSGTKSHEQVAQKVKEELEKFLNGQLP